MLVPSLLGAELELVYTMHVQLFLVFFLYIYIYANQHVVLVKFYLVIQSLLIGPAVRSYRAVLFLSMK